MLWIHSADWHIWDKHKYSIDGSRLKRIIKNAKKIVQYAIDSEIKLIVIAGDVFNISNPTEYLLNVFVDIITPGLLRGIQFKVLIGNHDTDGINYSLESIDKLTRYIIPKVRLVSIIAYDSDHSGGTIEIDEINGVNFVFVPWQPDMNSVLKKAKFISSQFDEIETLDNVLVTHVGVSGANVPSGYEPDSEIDLKMLSGYKYVALGDYHNRQKVLGRNIYYPGSIFRYNWGEADDQKGFYVVDTDTWKPEFIKLYDSPMIDMSVDYGEIEGMFSDDELIYELAGKKIKNSFIKLHIYGDIGLGLDAVRLEKLLYESGAKQIFTKLDEGGDGSAECDDIDLSLDITEATIKFAKKNKYTDEELEYGLNILNEVKQ